MDTDSGVLCHLKVKTQGFIAKTLSCESQRYSGERDKMEFGIWISPMIFDWYFNTKLTFDPKGHMIMRILISLNIYKVTSMVPTSYINSENWKVYEKLQKFDFDCYGNRFLDNLATEKNGNMLFPEFPEDGLFKYLFIVYITLSSESNWITQGTRLIYALPVVHEVKYIDNRLVFNRPHTRLLWKPTQVVTYQMKVETWDFITKHTFK